MSYCPEPNIKIILKNHMQNKIKVELDLSNYATKFDVKKQQVLVHHHLQKKL